MTHLLEAPTVGGTYEALNVELSRERADGPSLPALLACYHELRGIVQQHREHAALAIRGDLERGGLLPKAQGTDGDEDGNMTEPGQREGQVARALVR